MGERYRSQTLLKLLRLVVILALGTVAVTGSAVAIAPHARQLASAHTSDHARISLDPLQERSYMFDRYGNKMATLFYDQNRVQVPLDRVPDTVVEAIIAVEDENFYQHKGVNVRSILRAASANLEEGGVSQGGSTITQQVVKNSIVGDDQDLKRKLREAFLAVELEEQMTKDEILERYVNTIYFGNGAYGVQAAAELYFGKDVETLEWVEAALLAALIRNPNDYDPFKYPTVAKKRRALALRRLVETGHLTRMAAGMLNFVPLPTQLNRPRVAGDYFVEQVRLQLLDDERLGATPSARFKTLYTGGLRIYTTYDPIAQHFAREARKETLTAVPGDRGDGTFDLGPDPVTGAPRFGTGTVAAVDPGSGAVRVLLGGPGFERYEYDINTYGAGRQPGSSFKPFVLATALEQGYSPTDLVDGTGPCGDVPGYEKEEEPPQNFGGSRGGIATITSQTLKSSNCAYLRLGQVVGPERVADLAARMGITTPLEPANASMAIGAQDVHPLDMAVAYSVFANDGVRHDPYFVDRVEDREGRVLFSHEGRSERVLSTATARLVTDVLEQNVRSGTGTRARLLSGQPAAGKTGTTNGSHDVWFVGYTPQLSVSVWIGSPEGQVPLSFGGGATGGRYPAETWGIFMSSMLENSPIQEFAEPPVRPGAECIKLPWTLSCRGTKGFDTSGTSTGSPPRRTNPVSPTRGDDLITIPSTTTTTTTEP
jgi:penicillin-binding protein 1A